MSAPAARVRQCQRSTCSTPTTTGSRSVAVLLATTGRTTSGLGCSKIKTSAQKNQKPPAGPEKSLKVFGQQEQASTCAGSVAVLCSGASVNCTADVKRCLALFVNFKIS